MEEKQINKILKQGKGLLIITLVFLAALVGLLGAAFYIQYDATRDPKDLGELIDNYEDKEGTYVKLNVAYVPYGFAEEGTDRHYYFAMDEEKYMYIVRITDKTYEHLESLYKEGETFDYELKGYAFNISSKLKKIAIEAGNEAFEESVLTSSNFSDYFGNVYIDEEDRPENETVNILEGVAIFAGVFLIVFGITFIVQKTKSMRVTGNKELMEDLRSELEGMNDNEYGKLKIYLTNKYIISKLSGLNVIEYKNVIWEYSQIRYVNGVAQGKTLILCTKDKRRHSVAAAGADDARIDEIMVAIKDKNDQVKIGFTKENRDFFKNYQKEVM